MEILRFNLIVQDKRVQNMDVYLGSLQTVMSEAMKFMLNKKTIEKGLEAQDVSIAISEVQLAESTGEMGLTKKGA